MGRRPSPKRKRLKNTKENSSLLRFEVCGRKFHLFFYPIFQVWMKGQGLKKCHNLLFKLPLFDGRLGTAASKPRSRTMITDVTVAIAVALVFCGHSQAAVATADHAGEGKCVA